MGEDKKLEFPIYRGHPKIPSGRKLVGKRPLVGRDELFAKVKQRLLEGDAVALCGGLPGCGKTEMAAQLARDAQIRERFKDGILWVGLGDHLIDKDIFLRLSLWAEWVGVPKERLNEIGQDKEQIANEISDALWPRCMLLVIDDAWDSETAVLFRKGGGSCSHLMTTRLFHVANDFAYGNCIQVPELDEAGARELLAQYIPEVVVQRPEEAKECLKIAAGLPLALNLMGFFLREAEFNGELDAALKKVADVKEFFRQELPYLLKDDYVGTEKRSSAGEVPPNLMAIIAMSEESLQQQARDALRALTVFPPKVNTFSFKAGVAVAESEDALKELQRHGLAELIDRENKRYTMHMAIWEYAYQGLQDKSAYKRMAQYFVEYVSEHEAHGQGKTQLLESLEQEHDNLRHALDQLIDNDEALVGLQLAGALWKFWYERSYFDEGRQYIEKLCKLPGSKVPDPLPDNDDAEAARVLARARAKVINDAGNLAYNQGDLFKDADNLAYNRGNLPTDEPLPTAEPLFKEALGLREQVGDEQGIAGTRNNIGLLDRARGDYSAAKRHFHYALKINRNLGNKSWAAVNLNNLGVVAAWEGDGSAAEEFQKESLEHFRSLDDDWGIAMAQSDLGAALLLQGKYAEAVACYKEGLKRREQIKDNRGIAATLRGLAGAAMADAKYDLASIQYRASLGLSMKLRDLGGMIEALEGLAALASSHGQTERVVRFYAATHAFRQGIRFVIPPAAATTRDRELDKARAALADERFEQIWQAAATSPLDAINDLAQEALEGPTPQIEQVLKLSLDEEVSLDESAEE